MKQEYKTDIKNDLKKIIGREVKPNELINMENDALLLARFAIKKIEELEAKILNFESSIKVGNKVKTKK